MFLRTDVFTRFGTPTPVAVTFDGTNDYWLRGAGLTGAADSQFVAGYLKFKINTISANHSLLQSDPSERMRIRVEGTGIIAIITKTSANAIVCQLLSSSDLDDNVEHEVHWTYNGSTGAGALFVDGVDDKAASTENTGTIDFTQNDWSVGATVAAANKWNGTITRVAFWITDSAGLSADFDITTVADRNAMADEAQRASLGSGSILDMFGAAANWNAGTNFGNGGSGIMNGAVT